MNSEATSIEIGNILIVDDQPNNLRVLDKILTDHGYKVRKSTNGSLAIKSAESNPPDLILLDIKMPDMDGYQTCEILKQKETTREIPIIFLSALDEVINKVRAFEVGGVDYITKPFQTEEVLARIKSQLIIQHQKKILQKQIEIRQQKEQELSKEIQKRRETEEILYQSRALIKSVLNSSLDGIAALQAVRDITGEIVDFRCLLVNPVMAEALELKKEILIGKPILKRMLNKIDPNLFSFFVTLVQAGTPIEQDFFYNQNKAEKWYHFMAVKLGDGFAITVRDITERKQIELKLQEVNEELERLANLDGLTQIANRRLFDAVLAKEWKRCAREQFPLSLILIDIDYFKDYNDYYGHQMGDTCLIQVAQTIEQVIRRPMDLVARYGGEEFGVILPNTDLEGAIQVAEMIRQAIKQLNIFHAASKISDYLTLSLGIASQIPSPKTLPDELITQADRALYRAKNQGRNRLVVQSL